jgi:hypothetical protein
VLKYSDQQYTIVKSVLGENAYNKLIEDIEGVVKDKKDSISIKIPDGGDFLFINTDSIAFINIDKQ